MIDYLYVGYGVYLIWRYSYLLDYGYKVYYYGSIINHAFAKPEKQEENYEDWVLCETDCDKTVWIIEIDDKNIA